MIQTLEWTDSGVRFIDQTKLPMEETYVTCKTHLQVADVIRNMVVRGAPAIGVAAGEVPVAFQGLPTVAALAKGGKLRLIGITTPRRLPQFPDVPTLSESGLPGFEFNSWATIVAPAGTPKEIIARLNAEIARALDLKPTR